MKSATPALIELLESGRPFLKADLYTLQLSGGTIYRFTSFDIDLVFNSNTYVAAGPVISRTQTRTVIGLEVCSMDLTIAPKDSDTLGGLSWFRAACSGVLDDARITVDTAFIETVPNVVGILRQFVGLFAPLTIDRGVIEISCNSPTSRLDRQFPRNLCQSGCVHTLFDSGCALNRATYAVVGSVAGSVTSQWFDTSLGNAPGWFDTGTLQFSTGVMAGLRRTVKRWDGVRIAMLNPLPVAPGIGDTFTVWPGCARTRDVCEIKFGNLPNFKGYPYVPVPETAI